MIDNELAEWLRRRAESEGRSVSLLVREVLMSFRNEEEDRYWAREGEERLASFDPRKAFSHEEAWGD
ncbi:MAG: antitoxin, RHH family protein [Acidobacteriota bacterium]